MMKIDAVFTYGDPEYYRRVGFQQISTREAMPPFELDMPHGWLVQSLDGSEIESFNGRATCRLFGEAT